MILDPFILGRIAGGIGATCTAISQAALSDMYPPQTRAKQFGLVGLALTIAMMVGPAISKLLANPHWSLWLSVTTPLYFCLFLSLCSAMIVLFFFQDTPINSKVAINKPSQHALKYLLIFLIMEIAWSYYFHFTMLTMLKYHHQLTTSYLIFIGIIMSWALTIGYRALERQLAVEQILLLGLVLLLVFLITINFVNSLEGIYLNVVPVSIGVAIAYSASLALTTKANNPLLQGFILGSSLSMMALAWAVTGFCVSHSFPEHTLLLSSIIVALVAISILMTTTGKHDYA